ncbi:unnamed protein product [Caenorhabditis brenneri]
MEEIEIKEVKFDDFATLLSLFHPKPFEITVGNAENLLKLADRFLLSNVKFQVEVFIKSSTEFNRYHKLLLSDKYNLENLLEQVEFEEFATEEIEIKDVNFELYKVKHFLAERAFFSWTKYFMAEKFLYFRIQTIVHVKELFSSRSHFYAHKVSICTPKNRPTDRQNLKIQQFFLFELFLNKNY